MKLLELVDLEFKEGRSRKEMGSGVEHAIYTSTDEPGVVYKLGPKKTIDRWYETFKNNPDIFPEVYKRGRTKTKLKTDMEIQTPKGFVELKAGTYIPIDYVKLEKLDTNRAEKEWATIDEAIEEISERDGYEFLDFLISYMNGFDEDQVNEIKDGLSGRPDVYKLFVRYVDLVDKIVMVHPDKKNIPDIHRYNFGYDKNGNLKCLDF